MKYFLPLFFVLLSLSAMSQFLNESFESGVIPADWTFEVINFDNGNWSTIDNAPTGAHTGSYCAKFEGSSGMALVSPEMDITSATNPYISFWYYMNSGEYIKGVYIKTSATGSWIQVHGEVYETTTDWTELSIQLPDVWSSFYVAIDGVRYTDAGGLLIDDVKVYDNVVGPSPTSLEFPADAQANLNRNSNNLVWNVADGFPTGYKVHLGTDGAGVSTPTDVVNAELLTDTIFGFANLEASTTYYWQIIPTNANADATACPIWSFSTSATGLVDGFPWKENFDGAGAIPTDWTNIYRENSKDWTVEDWSSWGASSDHTSLSTGNYAMVDASLPNEMEVSMASPIFNLSALTSPRFSFWYNSVYSEHGPSTLYIDVYNGTNWILNVLVISADDNYSYYWKQFVVDLSPYSSASTIVRFRTELGYAADGDVVIDDVQLYDGALDCVSNILPINDDLSQVDGLLTWDPVSGAEGYIICFGSDGEGFGESSNIEYYNDLGNVTEYSYAGLTHLEDYYWTVYAYNSDSYSDLCSVNHFTVDNTVNIEAVENNTSILIFPNPSNGQFTIEGEDIQKVEIVDVTGKIVKSFIMNNEQLTIDLSNKPEGVYIVKIIQEGTVVNKNIILK